MNIIVKFPTRNRPEKFREVFQRYHTFLSGKHNVRFVVSMDQDDAKMNTQEIKTFLDGYTNVSYFYGNSSSKIEAINANLDNLGEFDVILLASDDMIPNQNGYDDIIANAMIESFPDTDGVLGFKDGRRPDDLITFTIMGRKYFDRFGYLYNPAYTSVFCDNEFTEVAKILNRVRYYDTVLFVHGWANYVGFDELMQRNENPMLYSKDHATYLFRKSRKFDLKV